MALLQGGLDSPSPLVNVNFIKLPAACSKTLQPADNAPGFRIEKELVRRTLQQKPLGTCDYDTFLETKVFKGILSGSRKTFVQFLRHAPAYLSKAFQHDHVLSGFQNPGIFPFDVERMLSRCTSWGTLSAEQQRAAITAVGRGTEVVAERGQVSDAVMQALVGTLWT